MLESILKYGHLCQAHILAPTVVELSEGFFLLIRAFLQRRPVWADGGMARF